MVMLVVMAGQDATDYYCAMMRHKVSAIYAGRNK
jgi:hypothetical protein